MKTRHFSFISLLLSAPALMLLAAPLGGGCGGSGGSPTGGGGSGGGGGVLDPNDKISDFEDIAAATVVNAGTPPRNGYWFSYNDASPTCVQTPINGDPYLPSSPPTSAAGPSGGMALHAVWDGCTVWGAGVGADIAQPSVDGGSYMGPKVNYDLTGARGITFWGMTSTTADNKLRIKLNMRAETKVQDAGTGATAPTFCDEATVGVNKCSDAWGQTFTLPIAGNWQQITILFSDTAKFKQEGWGAVFPWNPADVTGIQIQSQGTEMDQPFDFWIDDVYIIR